MISIDYKFPYNPSGDIPECDIVDERHSLVSINTDQYQFIIPKYAPFFDESIVVKQESTNKVLVKGTDYILTHRYYTASNTLKRDVYSSITFTNKNITGSILVSYATLGGDYTGKSDVLLQRLVNDITYHRSVKWEDVVNIPGDFPPKYHVHKNSDIHDMDDVIDAISGITAVLLGENRPNHIHPIANIEDLQEQLDSKVSNDGHIQLNPLEPAILDAGGIHYKLVLPSIFKSTHVYIPIFISSDTYNFYIRVSGLLFPDHGIGEGWTTLNAFSDSRELIESVSGSYDANSRPTIYLNFKERTKSDISATVPYVVYDNKVTELLKGIYEWEVVTGKKGLTVRPDRYTTEGDQEVIEERLRRIRLNTLTGEDIYTIV